MLSREKSKDNFFAEMPLLIAISLYIALKS